MDKKYTARFTWEVMVETFKAPIGLFQLHKLKLLEVKSEGAEGVKTFIMKPNRKIKFTAGQYGAWFLPAFIWGKPVRLFTIASSPTEDTVRITTHVSDSPFKKKLDNLPIGSSIYMSGPLGVFTLGKNPPRSAVLVAGGIGATPMRAIAKYARDSNTPLNLTMIHVSREFYVFESEFKSLINDYHQIHKENLEETLKQTIEKVGKDTPFYLSGPPAFVVAAESELRKLNAKTVKKDGFLGY